MSRAIFQQQVKKIRLFLGRILSFWLLLAVGLAGIVVAVLDAFSNLGLVHEKTHLVIAVTTSLLLIYVVVERAQVLDDIRERLSGSSLRVYPTR